MSDMVMLGDLNFSLVMLGCGATPLSLVLDIVGRVTLFTHTPWTLSPLS